jgi:hypothetical protein
VGELFAAVLKVLKIYFPRSFDHFFVRSMQERMWIRDANQS